MGLLQKIMIDPVCHYKLTGRGLTSRRWAAPTRQSYFRFEESVHKDFGIDKDVSLAVGTVYVDTDEVKVGDILWPGLLADAPVTPPETFEVLKVVRLKNAKGTKILRMAAYGTKGGGD